MIERSRETGGWTARNREELASFLDKCSPGDLAVFDWDNTCCGGDIGDAFFWWQARNRAFLPDGDDLVRLLDAAAAGRGTLNFPGGPAPWAPLRERLWTGKGDPFVILVRLVAALAATPGLGDPVAYAFQAALLAWGAPVEVRRSAGEVFTAELERESGDERMIDPESGEEICWRSGLRPFGPMAELAADLRWRGVDVAVVSATATPVVQGAAAAAGFAASKVIGQDPKLALCVLGGEVSPAEGLVYQEGKVTAIRLRFGRDPVLVCGDSPGDVPMMTAFPSTRLRLIVDIGRKNPGTLGPLLARARAGEEGWLVQPADPVRGVFSG